MTEIIPAIMPRNLEDLVEAVKRFVGVVPSIQVDIMDGILVGGKTWPYDVYGPMQIAAMAEGGGGLPFWKEIGFEFDLMVDHPERTLGQWVALSPKRLIFHIESTDRMMSLLQSLGSYRGFMEVGLAIDIDTPNERLTPYLDARDDAGNALVDFVQCMGIARIGYQGEPFDERVIVKIQKLRERYPDMVISVDGGVNFESAPKLLSVGVNRLVSGSALLKSDDVRDAVAEFERIAAQVSQTSSS